MKRSILLVATILILVLGACSDKASDSDSTTMTEQEAKVNNREGVQNEPLTDIAESEIADGDLAYASSSPAPTAMAMVASDSAAPPPPQEAPEVVEEPQDMFFEDYGVNPFIDTADDHLSTFAMDVDTASYTLTRSYLQDQGLLPPPDAIRPEEFVNYFDADYPLPEDDTFGIYLDAVPTPFGYEGHYALRVGIQGKAIAPEDRTPASLIFVIDVSGSMDQDNRLGLVKESLSLLVGELREDDRVGIVVYSDNSRVVLEPTPAIERDIIMSAINSLRPEGSTNVSAGLTLAYDLAQDNLREDAINRVIVLSDGVANVDITSPNGILGLIEDGIDKGITLSTIGFGMGNYNDVLMEQVANQGNGNYYYIDNLRQARQVFVHNLTGTLQVIGYDAKIQVDFNAEVTDRYRLIGYENRAVADEDFRNDTVDAGEVGAGHSITALYEIAFDSTDFDADDVIATVYIRYQDAETDEVVELEQSILFGDLQASIEDAAPSLRLHIAAAEFAELLRGSIWAEEGNYVDLLQFATHNLPDTEQVSEFVDLVRAAGRFVDTGR